MGSADRKLRRLGEKKWDKRVQTFQRALKGCEPLTEDIFPWQLVNKDSLLTRSAALTVAANVRADRKVRVEFEGVGPYGQRAYTLAVEAIEGIDREEWEGMTYAEFGASDLVHDAVLTKMLIEYDEKAAPTVMASLGLTFAKLGGA